MKHFKTYLLCLGLALTTASCSQDDFDSTEATSEKLVEMSFIAGSSQPVTRTVLGTDGSTVTWQTNDQIGIGYYSAPGNKSLPFKTSSTGSNVIFWGQAADQQNPYFMMYPYQEDAKILQKNNVTAEYQYTFPKNQQAVAGTFDPKANVSVGIIPQRGKPFIAYNVGGLLRFTIKGTSNVKQVKLLSIGQENLAGNLKSTITFANDGKISAAKNEFTTASPVVNLTAESGSLEENKAYYIALPEQKLSQGLTLVFIMQDGKAILKKVKQEINIQRAKVYDLGDMTLDASKAKAFILKNQGLIEAVGAKVSGLTRTADGQLDIYAADNLEKILSYKGTLEINNSDKLTSIDELQYYRNVTGLRLVDNKNLAGELNFNKYPQLTNTILVSNSPLVTKIDVTGLDKLRGFYSHHMDGLKEAVVKDNTNLLELSLYDNKVIKNIDASNLPSLKTLRAYSNPEVLSINTTNVPNLNELNIGNNPKMTNLIGWKDNLEIKKFIANKTNIESYDFSKQTKLEEINFVGAAVKEIKGLSASGANLKTLSLANSHVNSLDISNNPNLTTIDLYAVKELTALDVTHNPNLTSLRVPMTSISTLDVSNNTKLTYLGVAHCKLSTLDIRHLTNLAKFYAGSQSPNGFLANITVTMTAAQKAKLEQVKPFKESANDDKANYEDTNSWVKVVVAP
jgi:leucine rich repeat protein